MYHVIHKESGKVTSLNQKEVNDMFADPEGRIVVCGMDQNYIGYWLIADADIIKG